MQQEEGWGLLLSNGIVFDQSLVVDAPHEHPRQKALIQSVHFYDETIQKYHVLNDQLLVARPLLRSFPHLYNEFV